MNDELTALRARVAELECTEAVVKGLREHAIRLREALDAAERDAARYRWLRETDAGELYSDYWNERLNEREIAPEQIACEFDAAIDAAMQSHDGGSEGQS